MSSVKIELSPYREEWRRAYREEARRLLRAWPRLICELHHVGSTSVAGLVAKPIIDILVAVWRIESVDDQSDRVMELGYEHMGEYGIPGRRYFRKRTESDTSVNVHVFQCGNEELARHLRFRDYLIAHEETARAYAAHKRELAQESWDSTNEYAEAKTEFIRRIERRAYAWQRGERLEEG